MANEKSAKESGGDMRTITLTNDQWDKLWIYLLETTDWRRQRISAWEDMACKMNHDGSPMHPEAVENLEYFRELARNVSEVIHKIH